MPAVPARGLCTLPHVTLNLLLLLVHLSIPSQKSLMVTAGTMMGRLLQELSCVLPISKYTEGSIVCDKCGSLKSAASISLLRVQGRSSQNRVNFAVVPTTPFSFLGVGFCAIAPIACPYTAGWTKYYSVCVYITTWF